jgi:hypothetical protein
MKQRIQVLAWKRHKHEAENSGAGGVFSAPAPDFSTSCVCLFHAST